MVDPDAPSPDDPKWADFLHWAVTNITCGDIGHGHVRPELFIAALVAIAVFMSRQGSAHPYKDLMLG